MGSMSQGNCTQVDEDSAGDPQEILIEDCREDPQEIPPLVDEDWHAVC